ncbi:hypothetical protein [Streptomyces murinus]|uniref:hypothetical protein n=1 Tax=Streptomyces murinus TaxID=33900 RepID=UPI0018F2820C|nr:hypothetical protein [Streptomyces murinus]
MHPEDIVPGSNLIEMIPGSMRGGQNGTVAFRVFHPMITAVFIDYSRLGGRGQALLASRTGKVNAFFLDKFAAVQRPKIMPELCTEECGRNLVSDKIVEILSAGGVEVSETTYKNLTLGVSRQDKILTEAVRVGHTWGLFSVDLEGTTLTSAGCVYLDALRRLHGQKIPGKDREVAMSYDLRNAKINNFQQGGVNLGSQIFNDNGSAQLPLEQAAELVRLVLDEAPSLLAHATVVHGELRRAQEEGASPDRGRIGAALANITAGLRAGSSALVLTEGIRGAMGF